MMDAAISLVILERERNHYEDLFSAGKFILKLLNIYGCLLLCIYCRLADMCLKKKKILSGTY